MPLDRRRFIGLIAASTATTLAGCGGGIYAGFGSGFDDGFTSFVWVLNLNPEFASADVSIGAFTVASGLPFGGLTARSEFEGGSYDFTLRDPVSGQTEVFDSVQIHEDTLTLQVFYRYGNSVRLASSPLGIVNYFDSSEPLAVDLEDDTGGVQTVTLAFEDSVPQASQSTRCRLRVSRASDGVLVYDSGLRLREDAVLLYPADPSVGLVGAVGLSYGANDVFAEHWPNLL